MSAMYKALVAAQKAFGPALKSANNPAFRSKYADLGACVEAVIDGLHANGFFLTHINVPCETGITVECRLIHESGEYHTSGPVHVPVNKNDAQGYGSALTYARRYSLMAVCGVAPEDDDGNQAAAAKPKGRELVPEAKPITDVQASEYLSSIANADSIEALQAAFKPAWSAAKLSNSQHYIRAFKGAYDERKAQLQVAA